MSDHHPLETGSSQKTLPAYVVGLVLSVVLTVLAFALTQNHLLSQGMLFVVLSGLAITQLIVQVVCFLGLNAGKEGRWNLMSFLFVLLIIGILAGGSLWIMYNLNVNMYN